MNMDKEEIRKISAELLNKGKVWLNIGIEFIQKSFTEWKSAAVRDLNRLKSDNSKEHYIAELKNNRTLQISAAVVLLILLVMTCSIFCKHRIDASTPDNFYKSIVRMSNSLSGKNFSRFAVSMEYVMITSDPRYLDGMTAKEICEFAALGSDVEKRADSFTRRSDNYSESEVKKNIREKVMKPLSGKSDWSLLGLSDNAPVITVRNFLKCLQKNNISDAADFIHPDMRKEFRNSKSSFAGIFMKYEAVWVGPECDIRNGKASVSYAPMKRAHNGIYEHARDRANLLLSRIKDKWYIVPDFKAYYPDNGWSFSSRFNNRLSGGSGFAVQIQ